MIKYILIKKERMNTIGKKFLSIILSSLMFAFPLSIFAAEANQFEEVCNFYGYANRDLISSNSDTDTNAASEKLKKYYEQVSEYIMQHPNNFDPKSDIGKVVQAAIYYHSHDSDDDGAFLTFNDGNEYFIKSKDIFTSTYDNIADNSTLIRNILFLKQTLLYLKEKNTDVFSTDNIDELNKLGDAVAYFEENLSEIIYSTEESVIYYIKSLPLSDIVKEDTEREILRTQVVDFGFLRSYDYIYDGFSLKSVTLFDENLPL